MSEVSHRIAYAELHAHSYFSLLHAKSSPERLAKRAAQMGLRSVAPTDTDNLYGAVRFAEATATHGIKAIIGAELTLPNQARITALVQAQVGYHNLSRLISASRGAGGHIA